MPRMLRMLLDQEQEISSALRLEVEEVKKSGLARQEKDLDKIKGLTR